MFLKVGEKTCAKCSIILVIPRIVELNDDWKIDNNMSRVQCMPMHHVELKKDIFTYVKLEPSFSGHSGRLTKTLGIQYTVVDTSRESCQIINNIQFS